MRRFERQVCKFAGQIRVPTQDQGLGPTPPWKRDAQTPRPVVVRCLDGFPREGSVCRRVRGGLLIHGLLGRCPVVDGEDSSRHRGQSSEWARRRCPRWRLSSRRENTPCHLRPLELVDSQHKYVLRSSLSCLGSLFLCALAGPTERVVSGFRRQWRPMFGLWDTSCYLLVLKNMDRSHTIIFLLSFVLFSAPFVTWPDSRQVALVESRKAKVASQQ
jgi:hypothetical protein